MARSPWPLRNAVTTGTASTPISSPVSESVTAAAFRMRSISACVSVSSVGSISGSRRSSVSPARALRYESTSSSAVLRSPPIGPRGVPQLPQKFIPLTSVDWHDSHVPSSPTATFDPHSPQNFCVSSTSWPAHTSSSCVSPFAARTSAAHQSVGERDGGLFRRVLVHPFAIAEVRLEPAVLERLAPGVRAHDPSAEKPCVWSSERVDDTPLNRLAAQCAPTSQGRAVGAVARGDGFLELSCLALAVAVTVAVIAAALTQRPRGCLLERADGLNGNASET